MSRDRRKVEFPKWVNRPWRIMGIEYDEVLCGGGTAIAIFLFGLFMSLSVIFVVFSSLASAYGALQGYRYYKNEKGASAIYYFLFTRGLIKYKESPIEYMDCEYINRKVIPIGYELEFSN